MVIPWMAASAKKSVSGWTSHKKKSNAQIGKKKKIKSLNSYRNAVEERAAVSLQELLNSHLKKFNTA